MVHGLINRAIQSFVIDTYGAPLWHDVLETSAPDLVEFEAMLIYDDALTQETLDGLTAKLATTRETVLEDLGTYLVSHPNYESLRRLLRFGGINFEEFLHSLEDLPDRAKLAVSDLELPTLELISETDGAFTIRCTGKVPGFGHALIGLMRGMADDYGVLVMLDHLGTADQTETIAIRVLDTRFAEGRSFELAAAPQ